MKIIVSLAATVFAINTVFAQKVKESDVPKAILESFVKDFKNTKVEKWEKEKDGNYEAEFNLNKVETSATYNVMGDLLETETEIAVSELPKPISDYIAKNFPGEKIKEASSILTPDGVIKYEAEINKKDFLFDADGNLLP